MTGSDYFENIGTSKAPVFVQRTGSANPFDGFDVGGRESTAMLGDLDGDGTLSPCLSIDKLLSHFCVLAGDLDLVFGHSDGWLDHFENIGTSKAPAFVHRTGFANPFNGFNVGEIQEPTQGDDDDMINDRWERSHSSAPALADFDGDGTFRPCPLIGSDRTSHIFCRSQVTLTS